MIVSEFLPLDEFRKHREHMLIEKFLDRMKKTSHLSEAHKFSLGYANHEFDELVSI